MDLNHHKVSHNELKNQLGLRNFLSAKTSVLLIFVSSK